MPTKKVRDSKLLTGCPYDAKSMGDYEIPLFTTILSTFAMLFFGIIAINLVLDSGGAITKELVIAIFAFLLTAYAPADGIVRLILRYQQKTQDRSSSLTCDEEYRLENAIRGSEEAKNRLNDATANNPKSMLTFGLLLDIEDELIVLRDQNNSARQS